MAGALLDDDTLAAKHPETIKTTFGGDKTYLHNGSPWVLAPEMIEHEFFTVPGVAHERAKFYETLGAAGFEFYRKAFR